MRDTISRFLALPFYMGCLSRRSNAGELESRKAMGESESNMVGLEGEGSSMVKIKKSWSLRAPSRSNISRVMERVIRVTFKGFTQMFAYKDIEDIKIETEMEIGFPTDVKHVTHIGYDGSMTTNPDKHWDHLQPPEELSYPSVSLKEFEIAVAVQDETPAGLSSSQCS